ncbi:MAG: AAA family ATPase [Alphaproteobacteria bacterium]|nr:AAA family ATPase [Alphaproteobacteria bacterium]NNF71727.1 AAA family ATPase [Paracoccaceae bacterium]
MTEFTYPTPPRTLEDTGLSTDYLIRLMTKIMNAGGTMTPTQISAEIKLPKSLVNLLIKEMTRLLLVESQGLVREDIKSDIRYTLTDRGSKWALEALMFSQYVGPAPVTLEMFDHQTRTQSIRHETLHPEDLKTGLSHLVLPDGIMNQVGPAANSARSVLLWGEPGNGKTSIAEALGKAFHDIVYLPYAIIVGNQIIKFFDETLHEVAETDEAMSPPLDQRWLPCHRPVVITGGELTLEMLDLMFEPQARFYEAPMHMKALGGVFVIDDFGRQTTTPREFLNRWIVPLEKGFDMLSLHTGKKFQVPFDQLVMFSTNMRPEELSDEAALRRIYFKIYIPTPTREDYLQIFRDVVEARAIPMADNVLEDFYRDVYEGMDLVPSGAHPGFLVDHITSACAYLDREVEVTRDLLDIAWRNVVAAKRTM